MFKCCYRKNRDEDVINVEDKINVDYIVPVPRKKPKYEKVFGEISDTSCENVAPPVPPPRQINFQIKEDNSQKSSSSEEESLFNISMNHSILSESIHEIGSVHDVGSIHEIGSIGSRGVRILTSERNDDAEIEPIFTINISIKNERNGVLIHRKIYL